MQVCYNWGSESSCQVVLEMIVLSILQENQNSSHIDRIHLKDGKGVTFKGDAMKGISQGEAVKDNINTQVGEVNHGINGELQAMVVNMAEARSSQVPRCMHCDVCKVFRGRESFKGQSGDVASMGEVKVCDQCRKRRNSDVEEVLQLHPTQGMLV